MKFKPFSAVSAPVPERQQVETAVPQIQPEEFRWSCAFCEPNKAEILWRGTSMCRACQKEQFRIGGV